MTPRAVLCTLVLLVSGLKSRERWGALSVLRAFCIDVLEGPEKTGKKRWIELELAPINTKSNLLTIYCQ